MLRGFEPARSGAAGGPYVPSFIAPLLAASGSGAHALTEAMARVVGALGFASFLYTLAPGSARHREAHAPFWSNEDPQWLARYQARGYAEIDPRLTLSASRVTPFVWDSATLPKTRAVVEFLGEAQAQGIASGVAIPIADLRRGRFVLALDSPVAIVDGARRDAIIGAQGDMMLLAAWVHGLLQDELADRHALPDPPRTPLSRREIECLGLAARGLTGSDIAHRLAITERTVRFHFSNINLKLAAANRSEAIAKALAQGSIRA